MIQSIFITLRADPALQALIGLAVGMPLGFFHFGTLWWNARALVAGSAARAIGFHVLRFAVLAVILYALAKVGAMALLTAAIGILVARSLVLRRIRSSR